MSRPPKDREPQSRLQVAALPSDAARLIAQRTFLRLVQFVDGRKDVRLQQTRDSLASADDDLDLLRRPSTVLLLPIC
jgi:hypothetical protein